MEIIMSDAPAPYSPDGRSMNHGGHGQNVLYEDGHVDYQVGCTEHTGDNFFLSERGYVEAGLNENDAVIGCSEARPRLIFVLVPGP